MTNQAKTFLDEESLYKLLHFIRGGNHPVFGFGIRTYCGRDPKNERLHEACLALEHRGLIYRHRVDGDSFLWMPVFPLPDHPAAGSAPIPIEISHPGEFTAFCDRCKAYRSDCLLVPYNRPPSLTPPETEPWIGPDYITERVVIDREDIRMRDAAMCAECRAAKLLFGNRPTGPTH